ncbi:arrestin [Cordyceps fumosorosea ARSEF 2679]|uniref:Arrestin n=1 Tax=Cordyceps fumosorosea (strain ARSEF 2679) TaxID=1081104 RepID=A0A167ND14_CORFA|nr:arrestin [Cordyceps fumosorosea ARSEF 2679]OAA55412.1 arrestin [Cordyceps fumosorosea ARSEF 2679]
MPSSNTKARAAALAPSIHPRITHHRPPSSSSHSPAASPHVDIRITNHYAAKVYTTGAVITGEAVLRTARDLRFDRVALQLVGLAATRNYMAPEVGQVLHRFLLLDMPAADLAAALPADRVLRAGRPYALPFRFVVPRRLPLGACASARRCEHPAVREHHLRLPPSVGGADAAAVWGGRDDGSPETARVRYCVCVAVLQRSFGWAPDLVPVLRAHREVNVLPAYAEDPPLDIQSGGDKAGEYRLAASKTLRRSLVTRRLGVEAGGGAGGGGQVGEDLGEDLDGERVHGGRVGILDKFACCWMER